MDFHALLTQIAAAQETEQSTVVHCDSCGAEFTPPANVHAAACAFCGSTVVSEPQTHQQLKPGSLLPFKISAGEAQAHFARWLQKLWFAPNQVKRYARPDYHYSGMYVPYWTYDCQTTSFYRGERGDEEKRHNHSEENSKQRREIRWTRVSGRIAKDFDDILVIASESLPKNLTERLEPWDLASLQPYQQEFLSGFQAESYQIDVEAGFKQAKTVIDRQIRGAVQNDIGGDRQKIDDITTDYQAITCKHVLLPVYLAAYRYRDQVYQFVINGRTGEVQGQRPYSKLKIALTIAGIVGVIAAAVAWWNYGA